MAAGAGRRRGADPRHQAPFPPGGECGATAVSLTEEELVRIDALAPLGVAAGDRYANMEDLFGL